MKILGQFRLIGALFGLAVCALAHPSIQTTALTYRPLDAKYSTALARIITISANPNVLHVYDPELQIALSAPSSCGASFASSNASVIATGSLGKMNVTAAPTCIYQASSQCAINGTGSSVTGNLNTLKLTLAVTFNNLFAGNKTVYPGARKNTQNSGWQAVGSAMVP